MAGHSKWANIKRRKEAQDAKKSKIFSRIIKEISVAVKEGGNDPESNSRLRMAIQNAKGVNMPKDNIERAIKKASSDGSQLEKVYFEGYAQGGVAIFVECLTDNRNRTVSSVRSIFTKNGGSLGKNGSISYLFDQKGIFTIPRKEDMDLEEMELELIDAGAEDLEVEDDFLTVTTAKEDFGAIQKKLEEMNIQPENASLQQVPKARKALDLESSLKVMKMVDAFEEDDDVQNVYHNLELTDELQEALNKQ
ncbi:MAG: YebC/PmpR family DNA-binding transcriptional regulator [Bacteroidales bacterium]|nr:YebC/PmpR family DNA-binding transcriptional regulator [Bacteroidales bacterium]